MDYMAEMTEKERVQKKVEINNNTTLTIYS